MKIKTILIEITKANVYIVIVIVILHIDGSRRNMQNRITKIW